MSESPLMPFGLTIRTLVHACRSLCSVNWQVFLVRHSSVSVSRGFAICEYARFRTEFEASRLRMFITLPLSTRTSNEGSQARSKATDLNSVLAGVLRFKSGPSHIIIQWNVLMFKSNPELHPLSKLDGLEIARAMVWQLDIYRH